MKDDLFDVLDIPKGKLIAVDLDGTLCGGEWWGRTDEKEPEPFLDRIDSINDLYDRGAHIIIYTARNPNLYTQTAAWLDKYGVMYHGIMMRRKPGADVYIDDKALNVSDVWEE